MEEGQESTQTAPETAFSDEGTSEEGQSQQPVNQPNDPEFMRADYTKKTMELAEARKAFEIERADFERQRGYNVNQNQQNQFQSQQQQHRQQVDPTHSQLVEQFGHDGANAILAERKYNQQQIEQTRLQTLLFQEEVKGRMKYGEKEWDKHNYTDNYGQTRNKVMDYRTMINPLTGVTMTLQDAWRLANPVDPDRIADKTKQEVYQTIDKKTAATPTRPTNTSPGSSKVGKAMTPREAYRMALNDVS